MQFNLRQPTLWISTVMIMALSSSCDRQIVDPILNSPKQSTRQGTSDSTYLPDLEVVTEFNTDTTQKSRKKEEEFTTFNQPIPCAGQTTLYVGGMSMSEALTASAMILYSSGACTVTWAGAGDGNLGVTVTRNMNFSNQVRTETWEVKWSYPGSTSTWVLGGGNTSGPNPTAPDLGNAGDRFGEGETNMEASIIMSMPPNQQFTYFANRDLALQKFRDLTQNCTSNPNFDGTGNAFLHAYWTALNARYLGPELAYRLVSAHEAHNANRLLLADMDHFNDNVGLRIARYNPNADPNRLASLVLNSILTGHGRIVINDVGYKSTSDICY